MARNVPWARMERRQGSGKMLWQSGSHTCMRASSAVLASLATPNRTAP
ncbi:hypothetical protein E2C01_093294 [Portunus trituberculatus]|uniref:Uncharacterized protein n=1 Tax=Portunus trituberculatus TaxID=210409 RepID=A0A5B7JY68_PORTR|nr:hypothetical protein [Portunus trituberculatus]